MDAKELRQLSDQEVMDLIQRTPPSDLTFSLAQAELQARLADKTQRPHWSTVPLFWISVIAAIAACIAAYPVLFP